MRSYEYGQRQAKESIECISGYCATPEQCKTGGATRGTCHTERNIRVAAKAGTHLHQHQARPGQGLAGLALQGLRHQRPTTNHQPPTTTLPLDGLNLQWSFCLPSWLMCRWCNPPSPSSSPSLHPFSPIPFSPTLPSCNRAAGPLLAKDEKPTPVLSLSLPSHPFVPFLRPSF
jgi:hypothetical protein